MIKKMSTVFFFSHELLTLRKKYNAIKISLFLSIKFLLVYLIVSVQRLNLNPLVDRHPAQDL